MAEHKPQPRASSDRSAPDTQRIASGLARLHAVTAALSGARSVAEAAQIIVTQGVDALGADAGLVALHDDTSDELVIVGAHGYDAALLAAQPRIALAEPAPLTEAVRTGQAIWLSDMAEQRRRFPHMRPLALSAQFQARAAIPLRAGDQLIGALQLNFLSARPFDDVERAVLEALAAAGAQSLARAQAEERFRIVVESMPNGMLMTDAAGQIVLANAAVEQLFGRGIADLLGRGIADLLGPEAAGAVADQIAGREFLLHHRDGSAFAAQVRRQPIDASTGAHTIYTISNITRRLLAEQAARESELKLSTIFELLPVGIAILDERFRIVYHNPVHSRIFCLSAEGLRRGDYLAFQYFDPGGAPVPPEQQPSRRAVAEQRPIYDVEMRVSRPDGSEFWVSSSAAPIGLPGWHVMAVVFDITARRQAERALRESEQKLSVLFDLLPVGITIFDEHPRIVYQNPAASRILGLSAEELRRGASFTFRYFYADGTPIPAAERPSRRAAIEQRPIYDVETRVVRPNGSEFWMSTSTAPIGLHDWNVMAIIADITARKQAEQALRESEASLKLHAEEQQALSTRLLEAYEIERRSIARELHDQIGQTLTGLKLLLDTSEALRADRQRRQLAEARSAINELLGQVRNLALDLRPSMLDDLGLLPAMSWLIDRYSAQTGVQVSWHAQGLDRRFAPSIETSVYRIAQEALTNTARHAGVGGLELRLLADEEQILLQIDDEGRGFEVETALASRSSIGLIGMRERVELLGGALLIESSPGRGTHLSASIPLARPSPQEPG